ncbi:hypothetical protein [Oceaniglobus roseus]|uniref:hypothetical protein n=1 Tax=Oceaniglobus roseus TaxID=1737570 RepID=UPI000C7F6840|nr:hypothetical protein [Kandeliimicrobium roseum]
MRGIPFLFLLTAALLLVVGMGWGIQMSASGDHSLSPAHGHLNLLGWVGMAVFGFYYALTPAAAAGWLARVHYGLALLTVAVLVPGIAMAIGGSGEVLAKVGSVLAVVTMLTFIGALLRHGVGRAA